MKAFRIICVMMLFSLTASAQQKEQKEIDWLKELSSRITINGYMQGGYAYSDQGDKTTSSFNFKRAIFWGRARITDRWSFLFMNNFALSKGVLEFWTDYRVTNNKALTVRVGQFQHPFSLESPLSPTSLELIDITSQSVALLGNGNEPLLGPNYGRDQGIMLLGDLFNDHFHYELAVMNGQGINTADGNSDKDVILKLEYKPSEQLRFVVSGQKGRGHAVGTAAWNPEIQVGDDYRRDRYSVGAEVKSAPYSAGTYKEARPLKVRAEWLGGKDGSVGSMGGYVTTTIPIVDGLDAVASVDYFDRNTEMKYHQTQATGGLQYWFYKNCRLQLQYTRTWSNYQKDYNWLQGQVQVAF